MRKLLAFCCLLLSTSIVFAYTPQQAQNGAKLFSQHCAGCHGPAGQGGPVPKQFPDYAGMKAPALVGPNALNDMQTAANLVAFISKEMPLNKPGSLKKSEYLDIASFALQANSIKSDGKPLTEESAAQIQLHPAKK